MDVLKEIQIILEKNPELKQGQLINLLKPRTGLARSSLCEHLRKHVNRFELVREKGRYYLPWQYERRIAALKPCSSLELDAKVERAVDNFRQEHYFLIEPSVKEIAVKVGIVPRLVEESLYRIAPRTGWREQSKQEAEKEAGRALILACLLKWEQSGEDEPMLEALREEVRKQVPLSVSNLAQRLLTNYSELIPAYVPNFRYPEKLEIKWSAIYSTEPPLPDFKDTTGWDNVFREMRWTRNHRNELLKKVNDEDE